LRTFGVVKLLNTKFQKRNFTRSDIAIEIVARYVLLKTLGHLKWH